MRSITGSTGAPRCGGRPKCCAPGWGIKNAGCCGDRWITKRGERCYLAASTVHRWLDGAGKTAQASVDGQLAGIAHTQAVGTDGLWAKLKGKAQRVVLLVVDSVSGLVYPPVVAKGERVGRALAAAV